MGDGVEVVPLGRRHHAVGERRASNDTCTTQWVIHPRTIHWLPSGRDVPRRQSSLLAFRVSRIASPLWRLG